MTQNQLTYLRDQESLRHNMAMEAETHRSNREHERLQSASIKAGLKGAAMAAAASRYGAYMSSQASKYGADLSYAYNTARNDETQRHNVAGEAQSKRDMWAGLAGDVIGAAARVLGGTRGAFTTQTKINSKAAIEPEWHEIVSIN